MTTNSKRKSAIVELKALLEENEDRLRTLFQELLQELLEQEMTRALAAAPGSADGMAGEDSMDLLPVAPGSAGARRDRAGAHGATAGARR